MLHSPLRLAALLLGGGAPFFVYGLWMDPDLYWAVDLNGLLFLRASLHGCAFLFALTSVAWIAIPRRKGGKSDERWNALMDVGMALGLATVPVPAIVGSIGLLLTLSGEGTPITRGLLVLHPIGYGLCAWLWLKSKSPVRWRLSNIATALTPIALILVVQSLAWRAEKRCYGALRLCAQGPAAECTLAVLELERYRPVAWMMNLDPLLMNYLRETGYLTPRRVPGTIPPSSPLSRDIAWAWKALTGEDIERAARARFRVLMRSKGYDEQRTARRSPGSP